MENVFAFVEFYLSPFIISVGLVYFFHGIVNYFFIGPNYEEGRKEMGRQSLLRATLLFLIGLLVFGIAHWFLSVTTKIQDNVDVDADVSSGFDTLRVPNTPNIR